MNDKPFDDVDRLCVNTLRTLALDMVEQARSGHPGLPMGAAPMAYVLWQRHLVHDPQDPRWPDRDRFVLSAGHGSALLYGLLHLFGYDLPLTALRSFRQWGSTTPGHPEYGVTPGVEATTGPLGQGTGIALGMAIAERALAHRFDAPDRALVDHFTYALVSDGDLMEGLSAEAASLAGHLRLGRLVLLYDSNDISLDGPTSLTFTEDVAARYRAYGWQTLEVADGDHDLAGLDRALAAAREDTTRPSLVIVRTTIGYGSPNMGGTSRAHGAPLGTEETRRAKEALGWDPEARFLVPDEARARCREAAERGAAARAAWRERLAGADADVRAAWEAALERRLAAGWSDDLPRWDVGEAVATRVAGGQALESIARHVPELIGGDADLSCSTKTGLSAEESFAGETGSGRNIRFGVREHAMAAAANGIAYHGGLRPYVATFLAFSDYMRTPVRLAALDGLPVVFVWTHDSLAVGEDGPTHQPVEHVMSLRLIPHLSVVRPGDAHETAAAWRWALESAEGPVALILSRQNLPVLAGTKERALEGLRRGAYVLHEPDAAARAIVVATGSELHLALEAAGRLADEQCPVRVVSMPCRETFERQDEEYRRHVIGPDGTARVVVEAGVTTGWERYAGTADRIVGVDRFGASAPGDEVLARRGITVEAIVAAVRATGAES